ncbi:MAG: hypothetical protein K2M87_05585 [Muribaculaceae bacterium]|nr:hypothetical protein [Muribaculaceae bacterium]
MKKILLSSLLIAGLAVTSCTKDEHSTTVSVPMTAFTHFSALDGSGLNYVGGVSLKFNIKNPDNTMKISGSNMTTPDLGVLSFATPESRIIVANVNMEGSPRQVIGFSDLNGESGQVSNLSGLLTQAAYAPGDVAIQGYPRLVPSTLAAYYPCMSFNISNLWHVNTFWPDMTYSGMTNLVSPQGTMQSYDNFRYRTYMKVNEFGMLTGKTDIIIYNAVFAPGMPAQTVVLQDLTVESNAQGLHISGTDITPGFVTVADGAKEGTITPAPQFPFNSFDMQISADAKGYGLVETTVNYRLLHAYHASFTGSCIAK